MGPYSHYILAAKLEPSLQPEQLAAYYWGAVAPDIRYLANLRREHTHLGQDHIQELTACYPHLRSFLLGYQVHVLIDQIDVTRMVGAAFPLNLVQKLRRKNLSSQQMVMLVEMYYLQSGFSGLPLSGDHNEVLSDLGITLEQTRIYHQGLQEYFDARSFEAAISAFQKIFMIQNSRMEKYMTAYRSMQKQKAMTFLFSLAIKNARLDSRAIDHVRSNIK